jgi:8-oxo-dGTP diphosphatase
MEETTIDDLLRSLGDDEPRHVSLANFIRGNEVLGMARIGGSVHVRGRSDFVWNYFVSDHEDELRRLVEQLGGDDDRFAVVEEWMVPILARGRAIAWTLPMVRFVLPRGVELPALDGEVGRLAPGDAAQIFEHSKYQQYLSVDYTRSCILAGPSVAIRDGERLVAWAMTQDDGAMGFLQVLDDYQRRGYGRRLTIALASELRRLGRLPFAYVAEDNRNSIGLLTSLGFARERKVQWFQLA